MSVCLLSVVLVQTVDGEWEPGIGDPTFLGWFTVFAYVAACWACAKASQKSRAYAPALGHAWLGLALLMGLLAINKQLDLQSWFTVALKQMALRDGWYQERRALQSAFIRVMVVASVVVVSFAAYWWRRHVRDLWLAGLGAGFIALFVVVRAASFHHVDVFLRDGPAGIRMNWVLELGGIACVWVAARRYLRAPVRTPRRGSSSMPPRRSRS